MTLAYRLAVVGSLHLITLSHASSVQVGDTRTGVRLLNRVLAIQRAVARFEGDELRFASYKTFSLPYLVPPAPPPVRMRLTSETGTIEVGAVRVLGATASSFIRLGNGYGPQTAEARIVDIRQFNKPGTSPEMVEQLMNPV